MSDYNRINTVSVCYNFHENDRGGGGVWVYPTSGTTLTISENSESDVMSIVPSKSEEMSIMLYESNALSL